MISGQPAFVQGILSLRNDPVIPPCGSFHAGRIFPMQSALERLRFTPFDPENSHE